MEIREDVGPLRRRIAVVLVGTMALLGVLHLRLFDLQILHGAQWQRLAENNRLRKLPVPGARGWIYDRRGRVVAENVPTWELLLFPDEAADLDRTGIFLARLDVTDLHTFRNRLAARRIGRLAPLVVGEDLSWNQVAAIRSHQSDYPELSIVSRLRRHYPFGPLTAHVVGHLRPVSQSEIDTEPDLDPDALVGATGIEGWRDGFLAGRNGERWVVVSAVGRQLGVVRETEPAPGRNLGLTLDLDLQHAAEQALGDHAGAIVALDPRSGAVRAMFSAPSFEPSLFAGRLSRDDWQVLQEDPLHPLQNRGLQGVYPPGSTIKPFLALAGLASGAIEPNTVFRCGGSLVLYDHRFRCWQRWGHGVVDLDRSIEASCDVYYYHLGQRLGIEAMARWLNHFGIGKPTGIDLASEASGLVGTPEWSRAVRRTPWYPGEAVSVSIGQGPVLATVVQLATAYALLANGGYRVVPHLVPLAVVEAGPRMVDPEHLARVVKGLRLVVKGDHGTARSLADLPVAGKTGTVQVARLQEGARAEDLALHLRHHAWFVGWIPLDKPELVVAVIVEHGGGGGSIAAPAARTMFRAWLQASGSNQPVDPGTPGAE